MSQEDRKKRSAKGNKKKSFLEKLPSNAPFAPLVRRPDYQLRRFNFKFRRSVNVAFIISLMLMGVFFIYIGGLYYVSNDENHAIYVDPITEEPSVIWKDRNQQTLFEGITAGILMYVGAGGFYMIHQATKYAYEPSTATKMVLGGIGLVIFALASIMLMFLAKEKLLEELFKQWN